MKPFREPLGVFQFQIGGSRFGMTPQPFAQFSVPLGESVHRNGISKAEGDKICAAILPPMREMSSGFANRRLGIKRHERKGWNYLGRRLSGS